MEVQEGLAAIVEHAGLPLDDALPGTQRREHICEVVQVIPLNARRLDGCTCAPDHVPRQGDGQARRLKLIPRLRDEATVLLDVDRPSPCRPQLDLPACGALRALRDLRNLLRAP